MQADFSAILRSPDCAFSRNRGSDAPIGDKHHARVLRKALKDATGTECRTEGDATGHDVRMQRGADLRLPAPQEEACVSDPLDKESPLP